MTTRIVAALSLALALLVGSPAHAAGAPERCRVADGQGAGRFAKCGSPGSVPAGQYTRKCTREGKACKVRKGKLAPAQGPTRAHLRTTRCDGQGQLARPTSRPCKRA
jgi:hypothetical protein